MIRIFEWRGSDSRTNTNFRGNEQIQKSRTENPCQGFKKERLPFG